MKASTIVERQASGRALRDHSKRSSHRSVGTTPRDPLELLARSSAGRVDKLVPLRHGRMAASPLTFFRGSAVLQAHDLGSAPHTNLVTPLCGDSHLLNFGGFATPDRQLVFDLIDFDETAPGPFEWDLKRLVASCVLAARHLRLSRGAAADLAMAAANSYRDRIAQYASYGALELWYERITFDRMIETAVHPEARRQIRRAMEKAASRTHESMLERVAEHVAGRDGERYRMRDVPPGLFHVDRHHGLLGSTGDWFDAGDWRKPFAHIYADYQKSLSPDRRELLRHLSVQDLAFRVAGVGDVGARCLVLLAVDAMGKPLFLQIKEAHPSVIAQTGKSHGPRHDGERVVGGQRLLQAAGDVFLGWTTDPSGRPFYVRQLRDMKLSADIELLDADLLGGYARLCGWALARAHARASGKAIEIAAYIGRSNLFAEALATYASAYADQVERDYEVFLHACRSGALEARTDDDLAADFRM
jgi:uncharacterized protein (DUF2252 family)